jgi:hypothetical protein
VPKGAQSSQETIWKIRGRGGDGRWGRTESDQMRDVHKTCQGGEGLGKAVAVKVAEVQKMASHVP